LLRDFSPRIKIYKNGTVERLYKDDTVPASYDPKTRVRSRDVTISNSSLSARNYVPDNLSKKTKIPLVIYVHGGGFCIYSSSSPIYHNDLNSLVSEANVIAVSPGYRLAPEFPIFVCYEDSWAVAHWATAHDPDPWLARWTDLTRVYFAGDSVGANITHDMAGRAGGVGNEAEPGNGPGPRKELGCGRVLVGVTEKDIWKGIWVKYYEVLKEGGEWKGEVIMWETKSIGHVFHLYKPDCHEAKELLKH
ncbi:hypothetical protein RND81_01G206100, partial [Saponaria officinalis]